MTTALTAAGVQQVSITIASSAATNTATISATGSGAFVMDNGENTSDSTDATSALSTIVATSSTVLTATRNTSATSTVTHGAAVIDGDTTNLIKSSQNGSITIATAATSGTATISAVTNANTAVEQLGVSSAAILNVGRETVDLSLATTTVTATRGGSNGATTVSFGTPEFQGSALNSSTQNVSITCGTSGTSFNATISSVTMANTFLADSGFESAAVSANSARDFMRQSISAATTVNNTYNTAPAVATNTANSVVVEHVGGVLAQSTQRGTITITAGTSNTAAITSAPLAASFANWLRNTTTNTSTNYAVDRHIIAQTSATVLTESVNSSATGTGSYEVVNYVAGSSTPTGTGVITEGADTAAGTGAITLTGSGAPTEGADTAAGVGVGAPTGSAAITEGSDTASGAGALTLTGAGAITEGADTAAGSGNLTITGAGAPTEGADTAVGVGAFPQIGAGAITEGADTAAGTGAIIITGTGAITEGADTASGNGIFQPIGSGAITEGADVAAGSGFFGTSITGTGAPTEGADTAAGVGSFAQTGTASITEGADTPAGSGELTLTGSGAPTEGADTANGAGAQTITGTGAIIESADTASGAGAITVTGAGSVTEGADVAAGVGTMLSPTTGSGSPQEGADTANGAGNVVNPFVPQPPNASPGGQFPVRKKRRIRDPYHIDYEALDTAYANGARKAIEDIFAGAKVVEVRHSEPDEEEPQIQVVPEVNNHELEILILLSG